MKTIISNNAEITKEDELEIKNELKKEYIGLDNEYFIKGCLSLRIEKDKEMAKRYLKLAEENFTKQTNNFVRVNTYIEIISIALDLKEEDEAFFYIDKLISNIDKKEIDIYFEEIDNILIRFANIDGGRVEAVSYYKDLLKYSDYLTKMQKIIVLRRIACFSRVTSNYIECIENHMRIINETEGANNDEERYYLIKSIVDIGTVARKIGGGYVSESILAYADNIKVNDKALNAELNSYIIVNRAEIKLANNEFDEAGKILKSLDFYIDDLNNVLKDDVMAIRDIFMCYVYINNDQISKAEDCIKNANDLMHKDSRAAYVDKDIYLDIVCGKLETVKENYYKALDYFKDAIDKSKRTSNMEMLNVAYIKEANIYNMLGKSKKEKEIYKELVKIEKDNSKVMSEDYYKYIIYKEKNVEEVESKLKMKIITIIIGLLIIIGVLVIFKLNFKPWVTKIIYKIKVKKEIRENKFLIYYQPVVNPKNKLINSCEGLLRIKNKNGIKMPNKSIADLRNCDMMGDVTIYILTKAIEDYRIISSFNNLDEKFYISINIDLEEILDDVVFNKLIDIYSDSGLRNKSICLELSGYEDITNYNKVRANIDKLREVGFKIAINNFNINYNSLILIKNLNYDVIKLEKSILEILLNSSVYEEIIKLLEKVIKEKDIKLIIEGIETKEEISLISNLKLNEMYVQGYYYCEPLNVNDHLEFKFNCN